MRPGDHGGRRVHRGRVFEAEDGPDDEFIFGLDRILDGIEALVQAKARR